MTKSHRQADTEIEITDEMFRAGMDVLGDAFLSQTGPCPASERLVAAEVYIAMTLAKSGQSLQPLAHLSLAAAYPDARTPDER